MPVAVKEEDVPAFSPVAVVGLACRLPGASDPAEFWKLLDGAGNAIGSPSPARVAGDARLAGLTGGFLDRVDGFDADFFGVAPREADALDPQQRLLLELAWEATEDAGIPMSALRGGDTAVYAAAMAGDYAALVQEAGDAAVTRHTLTGTSRAMLANRLSYTFGLRGPSLTVDSAQSSGLAAVHAACAALGSGESATAFVAAANLNLTRAGALIAERFGGVSPSGRASVLDAGADGYVRGEGAVVLLLKPLDRALADGDRIHAVIRSTALNNDGASPALTVPTAAAQAEVIERALRRARVRARDIQYVELHGTGTKVGDPIEAEALGAVLGPDRAAGDPLLVGSVKANIGHLEGAAGLAGLLKAILSVRNRRIPATLHHEEPDPAADLAGRNLRVVTASMAWPHADRVLLAGVSSFGMGGTNAHVIVEQPPVRSGSERLAERGGSEFSAARGGGEHRTSGRPVTVDAGSEDLAVRGGGERLAEPGGSEFSATRGGGEQSSEHRTSGRPVAVGAGSEHLVARSGNEGPVAVGGASEDLAASGGTEHLLARGGSERPAVVGGVAPFVVSAATSAGLAAQAVRLAAFVVEQEPELSAVASELVRGRSVLGVRAVVSAGDRDGLVVGLRGLAEGRVGSGVVRGDGAVGGSVGVVFGGQGSQRVGAGSALYERFPVFRHAFDAVTAELNRELAGFVAHPVRDVAFGVSGTEGLLDTTVYTQSVVFALETALYRLVRSWGIEIAVVAGHSIGGIVAAHVAGALSLGEAARLVAARGRLMGALPSGGAMVAVEATEDEVVAAIGESAGVAIAAINGPRAVVVSGTEADVTAVADTLAAAGRRTKRLVVSHAFHSAHMDPVLAEFGDVVAGLDFAAPDGPEIVSDSTGAVAGHAELSDPAYWVRHLRGTVRFADAVRTMRGLGVTRFVELSADAVLTPMVSAVLEPDTDTTVVTSALRARRDEVTTVLAAAGTIFAHGGTVDWTAIVPPAARIPLPTYAFQRRRYWITPEPGTGQAGSPVPAGRVASGSPVVTVRAVVADAPALGAHSVDTGRRGADAGAAPAGAEVAGSVVPAGRGVAAGSTLAADSVLADSTAVAALAHDSAQVGDRAGQPPETTDAADRSTDSAVNAPTEDAIRFAETFAAAGLDGAVEDDRSGESAGAAEDARPGEIAGAERVLGSGVDISAAVLDASAVVLGYADATEFDPRRTFKELGLDSLGATELAAALTRVCGVRVAATAVYDFPTPAALISHLEERLSGVAGAGSAEERAGADLAEPIAIVALSGRFPGGLDSPEALWELVVAGGDAIGDFPDDRGWDLDGLYDPTGARSGSTYARRGGFLSDAGHFDAGFFGIAPREAAAMDPQQRLVLEASWELFERAGIVPDSLAGSRTAVYIGATPQEYGPRLHQMSDAAEGYGLTGVSPSVVSGRVAYTFGLAGPAVTVDTACSSSLVALHLAVRALRSGETDLAVAGGVTVMANPGMFTEFSRQRGLSADGRCKAFAADADGTGWAEAVSLVLMERLSDARRHGHEVLAVVRGSAVNQDGASNGLTAPNGPAQQRVIRAALADAGLRPGDVDLVEAHGTGTALGDPIEAQALLATYGRDRTEPVRLGSLKSNIGHTQAAAGTAGLTKSVLALRHHLMPATLHAEQPSPHVDWTSGAVELLTGARDWPQGERPRRAAVSSFGISGTNAHVIIEEAPVGSARLAPSDRIIGQSPDERTTGNVDAAPAPQSPQCADVSPTSRDVPTQAQPGVTGSVRVGVGHEGNAEHGLAAAAGPEQAHESTARFAPSTRPVGTEPSTGLEGTAPRTRSEKTLPFILSGKSVAAVRAQARRLADHVATRSPDTAALASSLIRTRTVFGTRAVVTAADSRELADALAALADGRSTPGVVSGTSAAPEGRVAVVFGGQGSQRAGAGTALYERFPVFRAAFDAAADLLDRHLSDVAEHSIRDIAFGAPGTEGLIDSTVYTQPVVFALETALYRLIESWGVEIATVAGHSIGGVVAAHVAGALSLADAARLVAARGRLMGSLPSGGAMIAVEATETEVREVISGVEGVAVAAVNGPRSVVISGAEAAVTQVATAIREQGGRTKRLAVSHAFHSPLMDPVLAEFEAVVTGLEFGATATAVVSDTTGQRATDTELADPAYWVRHLRGTVRFADAVRTIRDSGVTLILELGADAVLTPMVSATLEEHDPAGEAVGVPSLRTGHPEVPALLRAVAALFTRGRSVDWAAIVPETRRVDLPTYAFQRERYWIEAPEVARRASSGEDAWFWERVRERDADGLAAELGVEATELPALLPALDAWHGRNERAAVLDSWTFRVEWRPHRPTGDRPRPGERWLLIASDDDGADPWITALGAAVERAGATAQTVRVDPATVDADGFAATLSVGFPDYAKVVSLLPVTAPRTDFAEIPVAAAALARALAGAGADHWVLTAGAVAATRDDTVRAPDQNWHWSFTAAAAAEGTVRVGGLLDLPPEPTDGLAARVIEAITGAGAERELALRGNEIRTRRLAPVKPRRRSARTWRPTGTVLITGGTGALGARVARRLAHNGVRDLLLVSRRGETAPGAADLIAELTRLGARPVVAACDIGDRAALAALLADIPADRPLTDVVHTAAILDDAVVDGLDADRIRRVHRVKVDGARYLHELTQDRDLASFVLFSSITGILTAPGQANYGPGNAYLDALAAHRRSLGLPATAIAWGHWGGAGIAGAGTELHRGGLRPMDPELAVDALERAVSDDETHVVVADVDWSVAARGVHAALLSELAPPPETAAESEPTLAERLSGLDAGAARRYVTNLVRTEVAAALGHTSPDTVAEDRSLRDQGLTSLSAVELRNRLRAATALELPATVVFDYPTVPELTDLLMAEADPAALDVLLADLDRVAALLANPSVSPEDRTVVAERLRRLLDAPTPASADSAPRPAELTIASDEDLIDFIGSELGIS